MTEKFTYNLKQLLRYTPTGSGEFVETGAVEFNPPSMDVFNESTDFEQIIMKSMMSTAQMAKDSIEDDEAEKAVGKMQIPTPSEMRIVIHTGSVPVRDIAKLFRKLACKTGYLDEKTKLKDSHFDKMSKEDFIDMMCGYASFFTFPSLLRGDEQEESGSR